jgi:hypothetical protein
VADVERIFRFADNTSVMSFLEKKLLADFSNVFGPSSFGIKHEGECFSVFPQHDQ